MTFCKNSSRISCQIFFVNKHRGGARAGQKWVNEGSLLQRTSSSDRNATATKQMHCSDLKAYGTKHCYFGSFLNVKYLTHFCRLFALSHFGVF